MTRCRIPGIRLISGMLECDDGRVAVPLYVNLSREGKRDLVQSLLEDLQNCGIGGPPPEVGNGCTISIEETHTCLSERS